MGMPKISKTKNMALGFPEISIIDKTTKQKNIPTNHFSGNIFKDGMNKPNRIPASRKVIGIILFLFEERKIAKLCFISPTPAKSFKMFKSFWYYSNKTHHELIIPRPFRKP